MRNRMVKGSFSIAGFRPNMPLKAIYTCTQYTKSFDYVDDVTSSLKSKSLIWLSLIIS